MPNDFSSRFLRHSVASPADAAAALTAIMYKRKPKVQTTTSIAIKVLLFDSSARAPEKRHPAYSLELDPAHSTGRWIPTTSEAFRTSSFFYCTQCYVYLHVTCYLFSPRHRTSSAFRVIVSLLVVRMRMCRFMSRDKHKDARPALAAR